jgi:2-polyprenyl-6-methoxyphenol hydroxylase-like FAD-dependent oxidoreductase
MPRIVIAGCGFAGGVMALRSLQLGFDVTLLDVRRRDVGGVEIIPSSARHLLSDLRLDEALTTIRPGYGVGMLRRHAALLGRGCAVQNVRFAMDSALERDRFEPSVPPR